MIKFFKKYNVETDIFLAVIFAGYAITVWAQFGSSQSARIWMRALVFSFFAISRTISAYNNWRKRKTPVV